MPKYSASPPYNVRRYGDRLHGQNVYYTRLVLLDGEPIGNWEDYAKLWVADWKRIQAGGFHLFRGRIIVDAEVPSA